MRAVLVFCEGNHDIVFATRSLGAVAKAEWLGQPISDLPSPFGPRHDPSKPQNPIVRSFIAERIRGRVLDGLRLMDAAHPQTPSFQAFLHVPSHDIVYALLKSGSDNAATAAVTLIEDFLTQLQFGVDITEVAAAFLFDADTAGVEGREATFEADHRALLAGTTGPNHGCWSIGAVNGTSLPTGLFVFHDPTHRTGTLEDIIAPMVSMEWPDRWSGAGNYLTTHQDPGDPVATDSTEAVKARVCITGQFRFPGDPMTQVIRRGGLSDHHFQGATSQALADFLLRVPWGNP